VVVEGHERHDVQLELHARLLIHQQTQLPPLAHARPLVS
jgi:hypothetical protein